LMAKMRTTGVCWCDWKKYFFVLGIVRFSNFPTQHEVAFSRAWGRSKRVSAMTRKIITQEFVVPTVLAIALGIALSIGAVQLTDKYLVPIDQAEASVSAR
jgi:hypothetical protein